MYLKFQKSRLSEILLPNTSCAQAQRVWIRLGVGERLEPEYLLTCLPAWHQSVWHYSADRHFSSPVYVARIQLSYLDLGAEWFCHFPVGDTERGTSKQTQEQDPYLDACHSNSFISG